MTQACKHLDQIQKVQPGTPEGCAECLVLGDPWVSLRLCLICGHIGCCDDSKNKHATRHFHQTNHPLIRGHKTKHRFRWCYIDERMV